MESPEEILQNTAHRTYPLPSTPWIMRQTWRHLLFAHWPVSAEVLQSILPVGIELDTYHGQAYVGVLPFYMANNRVRMLPQIPGVSAMPQINIRTYVHRKNKPGVYFLALDTNNLPAVWLPRLALGLPYHHARMSFTAQAAQAANADIRVQCRSERSESSGSKKSLRVSFQPISSAAETPEDSLEHWLVERYCLYTVHMKRLLRVDIHHKKWELQQASAKFQEHSLLTAYLHQDSETASDSAPLLHYAREMDALIWAPQILSPVSPSSS